MHMKKLGQRGFTLIELMIVVAIIGILAAVAIPKFAEMLRKSKEGATKGGLTNLKSALTIYISDNEGATPNLWNGTAVDMSALCPKYMEAAPTVKLGTYHQDTNAVARSIVVPGDFLVSTRTVTNATTDLGGWMYTSQTGGSFWVNCSHTDTKNVTFTNW
jgi:type IV pilus assembly protein PilA